MARNVATLLLLFAYGSCMEMRETVERTVMVRTTGSDLQPAATGYIYKKESDGPAKVTKMGESEVIEQFSRLYSSPQDSKESKPNAALRNAPQPHARHASTSDDSSSQSSAPEVSEESLKPVVELEQGDEQVDGIANEEFDKLFEDYMKNLDYKKTFADYLHNLKKYDHGLYDGFGYGDGQHYGFKTYRNYGVKDPKEHRGPHVFEKEAYKNDYLKGADREYYSFNDGGHKSDYDEADDHDKYHLHTKTGNDGTASESQGKEGGRFRDDAHEFKKGNDFYDGEAFKGGYAYAGRFLGSGARGKENRDSHEPHHYESYGGKGDKLDEKSGDQHDDEHSEEESGDHDHQRHADFRAKGQHDPGKSYNFEVKH